MESQGDLNSPWPLQESILQLIRLWPCMVSQPHQAMFMVRHHFHGFMKMTTHASVLWIQTEHIVWKGCGKQTFWLEQVRARLLVPRNEIWSCCLMTFTMDSIQDIGSQNRRLTQPQLSWVTHNPQLNCVTHKPQLLESSKKGQVYDPGEEPSGVWEAEGWQMGNPHYWPALQPPVPHPFPAAVSHWKCPHFWGALHGL